MPVTSPIAQRPSPSESRASTASPRGSASTPTVSSPMPVDARAPARGDEQPIAAQLRAVGEIEHVVVAVAAGRAGVRPEAQLDAVGGQRLADRLADRARLAREHVFAGSDERDRGAQACDRLRHLDADRPGAEDEQPARDLGEGRGLAARPDSLELAQPGDRRDERIRAGGDHDVLGRVGLAADRNGMRAGETPFPAQHLDAGALAPTSAGLRRRSSRP